MNLCQRLQMPASCCLSSRIYKKTLLSNTSLTAGEKTLVGNQVRRIVWEAALKPESCNIPALVNDQESFDELHWVRVEIKQQNQLKKLGRIFQKAIPYPLVLVFACEGQYAFHLAQKRISLNQPERRTVERESQSPWFEAEAPLAKSFMDSLIFSQLPMHNLKAHFQGIENSLSQFLSAQLNGIFTPGDTEKSRLTRVQLSQIEAIDAEVTQLKGALKKESQFNRQVEINLRLKALEKEKSALIVALQ